MRLVLHARGGEPHFDALAVGCEAAGHTVVWRRPSLWTVYDLDPKADAVVVYGLHGKASEIYAAYRAKDVPVWIGDLPRLRGESAMGFYLNSHQWLPTVAVREPVCGEVINSRTPTIALVCGQKPGDKAHGMGPNEMDAWVRRAIQETRESTGLPVVYRHHPKSREQVPADGYGADALSDTPAVEDEFARCALVVTFNSTTGWEAIAAGVPVRSMDPACAYAIYNGPLSPARRLQALRRAASSQWTPAELRSPDSVSAMLAQISEAPFEDVVDESPVVPMPAPIPPKRKKKVAA